MSKRHTPRRRRISAPSVGRPKALGFKTEEVRHNVWLDGDNGRPLRWTGQPREQAAVKRRYFRPWKTRDIWSLSKKHNFYVIVASHSIASTYGNHSASIGRAT